MEPDDIRVEIERRRKRAIDLRLRETLWKLYNSHLKYYTEKLKKDPTTVYPEIRETLEVSPAYVQFRVEEITYRVFYKEGPSVGSPGSNFEGRTKTPITIALQVDDERVFEFEMKRTIHYTPEMPLFSEIMGEVTSFIDGPWVTAVPELLQEIKAHENSVRDERQAPKLQQKLREDMRCFGL